MSGNPALRFILLPTRWNPGRACSNRGFPRSVIVESGHASVKGRDERYFLTLSAELLSYFEGKEKDKSEQTPAYTLGFELYENGVSRALRLDYGNFALKGELKSIEFLKPTRCDK